MKNPESTSTSNETAKASLLDLARTAARRVLPAREAFAEKAYALSSKAFDLAYGVAAGTAYRVPTGGGLAGYVLADADTLRTAADRFSAAVSEARTIFDTIVAAGFATPVEVAAETGVDFYTLLPNEKA